MAAWGLFDEPAFDAAECVAEVDADFVEPARVGGEGVGVASVVDLAEGLLGGAVELEFHDVDEAVGLQDEVDAAAGGVVLGVDVESEELEDDEENVLVV